MTLFIVPQLFLIKSLIREISSGGEARRGFQRKGREEMSESVLKCDRPRETVYLGMVRDMLWMDERLIIHL